MVRRKKKAYVVPVLEDPDDVLSREQVGYLFQVGPAAVYGWALSGRLIAVPGSGLTKFMATEVSRLYAEVGGSPVGHWRSWPRTPGRGLKQRR